MSNLEESSSSSSSAGAEGLDLDPLLKDLREKKQSFRHSIVSLAAELKDVRSKLASQEQSFATETLTRQVAERRAGKMEVEIVQMQKSLEERTEQLKESAFTVEKYLKEMEDLRSQLSSARATADASAASAQSAQLHCLALLEESNEKNTSLQECEGRINRLGDQLDLLQEDSQLREASHQQLKDEISRIEREIKQAVARARASNEFELRRIIDEVSPKNLGEINKHLTAKNEEIVKLRDEMRIMAGQWKLVTKDLKSQLEKHRRTNQELKKRILKLEFCLQEANSETHKLQMMGERKDKVLKELEEQFVAMQKGGILGIEKQNFWESSCFKIVVSMTMLIMVVFARR